MVHPQGFEYCEKVRLVKLGLRLTVAFSIISHRVQLYSTHTKFLPNKFQQLTIDTTTETRTMSNHEASSESWPMRLHTTPAYAEHHPKTTPTSILSTPFFEHLTLNVRCVLYDFLVLPPFAEAKDCAGLYLSCRQAKEEMDRAPAVEIRSHLLKT